MKALQNPWVSSSLAAAALLLVSYQLLRPWLARPRPARSPARTTASTPAPAPAPAPQTAPSNSPALPIDRAYARAHLAAWTTSPQRDPFRLNLPAAATSGRPVASRPSPVPTWKLQGIWRQTGGRIAAINNRVYAEGDSIAGYQVERIEEDQVWLQGPQGQELLGFSKAVASNATNPKSGATDPVSKTSTPNRL